MPETELLTLAEAAEFTGRPRKHIEILLEGEILQNYGTDKTPKVLRSALLSEMELDRRRMEGTATDAVLPPALAEEETPEPTFQPRRSGRPPKERDKDQPSPEDQFENWRLDPDVWKPGQTTLYVCARESDSNLYIPLNPNYWIDMPSYADLCDRFSEGAILRIEIKGPIDAKGKRKTIRGPITLAIAPRGEYHMSGYGSPFGRPPGGNGAADMKTLFEWTAKQQQQRDQAVQAAQTQAGTQWSALLQSPLLQKQPDNSSSVLVAAMMQQGQQTTALIGGMFQAFAAMMQANKPDKSGDSAFIQAITQLQNTVIQSTQQQNATLLQLALGQQDVGKQLELFARFKDLFGKEEDASGPAGWAKLLEAAEVGPALKALAQAGADRLAAPKSEPPTAPSFFPAPNAAPQNAIPNPYQPQPAPALPAPQPAPAPATGGAQPNDQAGKIAAWLGVLKEAFATGRSGNEFAAAFLADNAQHKEAIAAVDAAETLKAIEKYAPSLGMPELASTAGLQFCREFLEEVKRLAESPAA